MKVREVVENSSHHINGKHAESGCKGRLSIQRFLMDKFSSKGYNCAWIASDMRGPVQFDRAGTD
jgi:hypothetical protein